MEDNSIDRLLERALDTYSSAGPRPGLEQRVAARALGEPARRPFRWLGWAAIPALAAAVWTVIAIAIPRVPPPPAAPATRVFMAASVPPLPPPAVAAVRRAAHPRRQEALPKRPVFPTPAPLSGEERILLAFATHSPEEAAEAFRETPPQKIQPIVIPPLLETNDATH
jgi:hypothetical protein